MSLSVKNLNGDTSFLITFSPPSAPDHCRERFPGAFTILLDPSLVGHSSVWNTAFQISHHTSTPVVSSLKDLKPDLILISQAKPDHCHRQTLCTLSPNSKIKILAVPEAAKLIKSWKHFLNPNISVLNPYSAKDNSSVYCIKLDAYTANTAAGQMTISYIPEKRDMTGLHNAMGITYRPPGTSFTNHAGMRIDLPLSPPLTPSRLHTAARPRSADSESSFERAMHALSGVDSPMEGQLALTTTPPHLPGERTISVLYTPHGMSYPTLTSYIDTHLVPLGALPLTALFHSMNVERNPWILGGLVARGFPGGLELAQRIGAKYWISAHDEVKDNKGWATVWIKSRPYSLEEAQRALNQELGTKTKLVVLDSGQDFKT